jgi:hypothetical protein
VGKQNSFGSDLKLERKISRAEIEKQAEAMKKTFLDKMHMHERNQCMPDDTQYTRLAQKTYELHLEGAAPFNPKNKLKKYHDHTRQAFLSFQSPQPAREKPNQKHLLRYDPALPSHKNNG